MTYNRKQDALDILEAISDWAMLAGHRGISEQLLWVHGTFALAAGTRSAETSETSAPSEGCQSGPKGNAQPSSPESH